MNNNKILPKVKLYNSNGLCRKIPYPSNFEELIKKAKEFVPYEENTKRYQLIELKVKREITTQEDFELMTEEYQNEETVKIQVNLVNSNTEYLIPEKNDFNEIINESNINIQGKKIKEDLNENGQNTMESIIKKN